MRRPRSQAADRAAKEVDDLRPELRHISISISRIPWLEREDELDPDEPEEEDDEHE